MGVGTEKIGRPVSGLGQGRNPGDAKGAAFGRREAIGLLLGSGAAALVGSGYAARSRDGRPGGEVRLRRAPVEIRSFLPRAPSPVAPEVRAAVVTKLDVSESLSFSFVLHWLRLFGGRGASTPARESVAGVLGDLTDAGRLGRRFKRPSSLVKSPYGARYLVTRPADLKDADPGRTLHAYQPLVVFGEVGVPTATPLGLGGGRFTVADLVRDCLLNFQPREVTEIEPEWAVTALALYLPPVRSWRNRWGEAVSFDDIVRFLVGRDLGRFACLGTHLLAALATLIQVDDGHGLLSREVADKAAELCRSISDRLGRTQRPDGSWGDDWSGGEPARRPEPWYPVHVTGHLMECQRLLPARLQAPRDCLDRALGFLTRATMEASDADVREQYCPYSHAGRVVLGGGSATA